MKSLLLTTLTLLLTLLTLTPARPHYCPSPKPPTKLAGAIAASPSPAPKSGKTTVAYDTTYDSASLSTLSIACSDGKNGLYTKGYKKLGAIPGFPNIGAAFTVTGWNSPQCGKCYRLKYNDGKRVKKTIYLTAVDVARTGFVVSRKAMDTLTRGQAVQLGRVKVEWKQVGTYHCGFAK
ncbi:hypothetical protein HDV00_006080 [Rhizophlyctis rosea]|nr:hypothetical protein HDV00_006080 [Rhizophlyctis rosea]